MITLKYILLPTDFGETARVALKYAQALATTFNASIHLLHVLEDPLIYPAAHEGYFSLQPDYRQVMEQETYQRLETLLPEGERAGVHAKCVVRWGSPFVEIVRYAKSENMDMIVMGSHGLGPIAHMLMGSVAEKVVRKAPCPVLTVRHPEHEFVMP
jgi:nucleotide-binding universal stress UspA family protein